MKAQEQWKHVVINSPASRSRRSWECIVVAFVRWSNNFCCKLWRILYSFSPKGFTHLPGLSEEKSFVWTWELEWSICCSFSCSPSLYSQVPTTNSHTSLYEEKLVLIWEVQFRLSLSLFALLCLDLLKVQASANFASYQLFSFFFH